MSVRLVRETYLLVEYENRSFGIGVRTKDIGFTIGTELTWWSTGERLATYRPGTRYGDYAEELAAQLVSEALSNVPNGLGDIAFGKALMEAVRTHPDVARNSWNPDTEDEDDW